MLNVQEIQKLIPHRQPFLMVDKVLDIKEQTPGKIVGRVCHAQKNVTINEPFFEGHFPGQPVMPGVLILEAIAQTGALCCCSAPGDPPIQQVFFAGVDKVRFKKPVLPGDMLDLKVEMKKQVGSFFKGEGVALVGDTVAMSAEIMAHIQFSSKS